MAAAAAVRLPPLDDLHECGDGLELIYGRLLLNKIE
jgi:hypothetical protein